MFISKVCHSSYRFSIMSLLLQVLFCLALLGASSCKVFQFFPRKCSGNGGSSGNLVELSSPVTSDQQTSNTSSRCMSMDEALAELESDDAIFLSHGTYTIDSFSVDVVRDVSNVSIIGDISDPRGVTINCSEGVGLFFFNVTGLTISGVTVEQCGISGVERVAKIVNMTEEVVDTLYIPLPDFSAALYIVHCPGLSISNTVVRNNRGFGIVGINLIGTVTFYRVHVSQNYPSRGVIELDDFLASGGSGGGMFLAYQDRARSVGTGGKRRNNEDDEISSDTQLYITESNFTDNYVCRLNEFHVLHDKLPRSIRSPISLNFSMIGAGGVTLSLGQSNFEVDARFDLCTFRNNSGTYNGAALHISQFERSNNSHVFITRTTFVDNGKELVRQFGDRGVGPAGALLVFFYTLNPRDYGSRRMAVRQLSQDPSSVVVSDSTFTGNVARSGGGVCVISFGPEITFIQDSLIINSSTFTNNMADFGGALYLAELSYSGFKQGLDAHFCDARTDR